MSLPSGAYCCATTIRSLMNDSSYTYYRSKMASDRPQIVKREVKLKTSTSKLIFILDNVFTPEECEEYIKKTEKMGYEQALVNVGGMCILFKTNINVAVL